MRLSTRSTYGMRALVELALGASHSPISASMIAKRQGLSVAYLEQLLHRLKRQGLVRSIRGPRGGYLLAREPRAITMGQVVSILDGLNGARRVRVIPPVERGRAQHATARRGRRKGIAAHEAQDHAQRIVAAVWRCVYERLTQSLEAVTLQELCDDVRAGADQPLDHRYVFHI